MSDTTNIKSIPAGLPGRRGKISVEKPKNSKQVIQRLWKYLSRQKILLLIIIALLLINTGTTLMASYLLRPIINKYILPHNIPGLIKMIILLLSIYLFGAIAAIFQNRLMIIVAQKTISIIRVDLFSRIQSLPLKFFDSHNHGELMSRFTNDVDNISDSLNKVLHNF
jgi:ATP-binding cassette subfamily B multidrug efflux pump